MLASLYIFSNAVLEITWKIEVERIENVFCLLLNLITYCNVKMLACYKLRCKSYYMYLMPPLWNPLSLTNRIVKFQRVKRVWVFTIKNHKIFSTSWCPIFSFCKCRAWSDINGVLCKTDFYLLKKYHCSILSVGKQLCMDFNIYMVLFIYVWKLTWNVLPAKRGQNWWWWKSQVKNSMD